MGDVVLRAESRRLRRGRARRVPRRHRLFPLGGHLQPDGHRPVLGVCHRPLYQGTGPAAVSFDWRRQQPRRVGWCGPRRLGRRPVAARRDCSSRQLACWSRLPSWRSLPRVLPRATRRREQTAVAEQPLGQGGGVRADSQGSLSDAHCRTDRPPQRREHLRRVPVRPLRRRAGPRAVRIRPGTRGRAPAIRGRDVQPLVRHRESSRFPPPDVRGVEGVQVSGRRPVAVHPPARGALRLCDAAPFSLRAADGDAEGGGQQHRLFAGQYDEAGVVAADQPRGEVQGQAGGRFILRPVRGCAPGGHRLHRRASAADRAGIRRHQYRARRRLARCRRDAQLDVHAESRRAAAPAKIA